MAPTNAELVARRTGRYNSPSDLKHIYVPHTIYFYYVKVTRRAGMIAYDKAVLFIWEEDEAISPTDLKGKHIPELTKNARKTRPDKPMPSSIGFGREPWRRRSYLVVALDHGNAADGGFETDDAAIIERLAGTKEYKNHCFFDGGEEKIAVRQQDPIWVMWTVNYMKNRSGKDIPEGKTHKFRFKFKPKGRPIVETPDHGTNMGPPIGPP